MYTDITLRLTPETAKDAKGNEAKAFTWHLGTHFDVMDKEFPLEYIRRKGIVFDVSDVGNGEVRLSDVDLDRVEAGMFTAFYSGFIEEAGYGNPVYFHEHPQLSTELIEALLEKEISIIGIDFAGVRRGKEHTMTDQYCADHGVFVIENLCNLKELADKKDIVFHTYPLNFAGMSGLPCRVVAES